MINSKNKSTIPDTQISVAHIAHGDQCLYIHSFFFFCCCCNICGLHKRLRGGFKKMCVCYKVLSVGVC